MIDADAMISAQRMDAEVERVVEALRDGSRYVGLPVAALREIARTWAAYSHEPSMCKVERECATEFCAMLHARLPEMATDSALAARFRVYATAVNREFPERLLH